MRQIQRILVSLLVVLIGCNSEQEPIKVAEIPSRPTANESVVRAVISEQLKLDTADIPMDRPISDAPLKADELDLVEIVMELEDRLGIQISDAAIEPYAGEFAKGPIRITPTQLVAIVDESPKAGESKRKR